MPSPGGLAGEAASLDFPGSAFRGVPDFRSPFGVAGEVRDVGEGREAVTVVFSVCKGASFAAASLGDFAESFARGFCFAATGAGAAALKEAIKLGGGSMDSISCRNFS